MKQARQYIEDVLSGKELVCENTRLAVVRHINDLGKSEVEEWPFYFDEREAQKAINFLRILRHPSGSRGIAGERFKVQNNQAFITAMLFGWRRKEDGQRRFTKAYLEVSRKWGKSLFAAFIQIYIGREEGASGGGVFTAATTRHQADEVFRAAKRMCEMLQKDSKTAAADFRVMANSINIKSSGCFIQKVSSEAGDIEGKNPLCATVDEYHDHPTDEVLELMASGMGTWDAPMLFIITTAGYNKEYPCFRVERPNAVMVLKGERRQDNLFAIIYGHDSLDADGILELDPDKPEQAKEIIRLARKSNPNLGSTPTVNFILDRVRDARNKGGSTRVRVLTKNFNCWVDAPTTWIPEEKIKAVMRPIPIEEFYGRTVFLGIDLAAVKDLTALCLFSPADEERPAICKVLYWLPEDTVKSRNDVAPYSEWVENGYINTTAENIVDYETVRLAIWDLQGKCNISAVGYDSWNAWETTAQLTEGGFNMQEVRPFFKWQSPPTKRIEMLFLSKGFEVDENPVLLWNFRNVALDFDTQDNIKIDKKKSAEKIDGVAAMVDAIYVWLQTLATPVFSSYLFDEDAELITY